MAQLCFSEPFLETRLGRQLCRARLGDSRARHLGRRGRRRRGDGGNEVVDARRTAMGILLLRMTGVLDRRLRKGTTAVLLREVVDVTERGWNCGLDWGCD